MDSINARAPCLTIKFLIGVDSCVNRGKILFGMMGVLPVFGGNVYSSYQIAHKCVGTRPGARLAFVGGLETLKLGLVLDTYHLRTGQFIEIRDAYVRGFARNGEDAFATLKRTAELTGMLLAQMEMQN